MAELRSTFKLKLISNLEKLTGFYGEDFSFETKQMEETSVHFLVKNKFNNDIYFEFILDTEKKTFNEEENFLGTYKKILSYTFNVTMSPGDFFSSEEIICNGEEALFVSFETWAVRAWDEFKASSVIKKLEIQEQQIEELSEQIGELGEKYFTIEEVEKLTARLEEIEKTLQEHINQSQMDEDKKNNELIKISNDIAFLTDNLTCLNKKNWISSFLARFSPMKLDKEKRKKILQVGGKGLGMLIEANTGDSAVKEFIEEITKEY